MFEVFCGSKETMEMIASKGARGLNPKTMKWQVIDKTAQYEVREDKRFLDEEGNEHIMADLLSNLDLRTIAKEKGLIL